MNGQSFAFVGYLPVEKWRAVELEALARRQGQTQLMIETPYRNGALLQALLTHLGPQTRLSIACALTTPAGWTRTRQVQEWRRSPPACRTTSRRGLRDPPRFEGRPSAGPQHATAATTCLKNPTLPCSSCPAGKAGASVLRKVSRGGL